jgi:UDP-glucuronate 4-epimerase
MAVLLTGAAGFIGMHVARALLDRGEEVIGLDNLNPYYSVKLKQDRLAVLQENSRFRFLEIDLAEPEAVYAALDGTPLEGIIHLAAQAGVRYSLEAPMTYVNSNIVGHMAILELARRQDRCRHVVYASSSSVYGGNRKLPFSESDPVDNPVSLYAATKKADELISQAYANTHRLVQTGLRFFTVYGPWGRPDMALWLFTEAILAGRPIRVFNHGDMKRDFTYIDDIDDGVLRAYDTPPADGDEPPHRIYNIGNYRSEPLLKLIDLLEEAIGIKAIRQLEPMQTGDMKETYADLEAIGRDLGYAPSTPIEVGVPRFVRWFRDYHGL